MRPVFTFRGDRKGTRNGGPPGGEARRRWADPEKRGLQFASTSEPFITLYPGGQGSNRTWQKSGGFFGGRMDPVLGRKVPCFPIQPVFKPKTHACGNHLHRRRAHQWPTAGYQQPVAGGAVGGIGGDGD